MRYSPPNREATVCVAVVAPLKRSRCSRSKRLRRSNVNSLFKCHFQTTSQYLNNKKCNVKSIINSLCLLKRVPLASIALYSSRCLCAPHLYARLSLEGFVAGNPPRGPKLTEALSAPLAELASPPRVPLYSTLLWPRTSRREARTKPKRFSRAI